jgi:hypothetical protein
MVHTKPQSSLVWRFDAHTASWKALARAASTYQVARARGGEPRLRAKKRPAVLVRLCEVDVHIRAPDAASVFVKPARAYSNHGPRTQHF